MGRLRRIQSDFNINAPVAGVKKRLHRKKVTWVVAKWRVEYMMTTVKSPRNICQFHGRLASSPIANQVRLQKNSSRLCSCLYLLASKTFSTGCFWLKKKKKKKKNRSSANLTYRSSSLSACFRSFAFLQAQPEMENIATIEASSAWVHNYTSRTMVADNFTKLISGRKGKKTRRSNKHERWTIWYRGNRPLVCLSNNHKRICPATFRRSRTSLHHRKINVARVLDITWYSINFMHVCVAVFFFSGKIKSPNPLRHSIQSSQIDYYNRLIIGNQETLQAEDNFSITCTYDHTENRVLMLL